MVDPTGPRTTLTSDVVVPKDAFVEAVREARRVSVRRGDVLWVNVRGAVHDAQMRGFRQQLNALFAPLGVTPIVTNTEGIDLTVISSEDWLAATASAAAAVQRAEDAARNADRNSAPCAGA